MGPKLVIDEELRGLLGPLSTEEREQLRANILKDGRAYITIWRRFDDEVLVDGYEAYEIAEELGLPYQGALMFWETKEEAIEWLIENNCSNRLWLTDQFVGDKHVYFIQAGAGGPIKIGMARSVLRRMREIQPNCPYLLNLLGIIENGGRSLEAELHRRFRSANIHGEWFEPVGDLLDYISENAGACQYA